jgi:hypothetical protein
MPDELYAVGVETLGAAIKAIDGVSACEYVMCPELDVFEIVFNGVECRLVMDLDYGADLKSQDRAALDSLGERLAARFRQ